MAIKDMGAWADMVGETASSNPVIDRKSMIERQRAAAIIRNRRPQIDAKRAALEARIGEYRETGIIGLGEKNKQMIERKTMMTRQRLEIQAKQKLAAENKFIVFDREGGRRRALIDRASIASEIKRQAKYGRGDDRKAIRRRALIDSQMKQIPGPTQAANTGASAAAKAAEEAEIPFFSYTDKVNAKTSFRGKMPKTANAYSAADAAYRGASAATKGLFGMSPVAFAGGLAVAAVGAGMLYEYATGRNAVADAGTAAGQAQAFSQNMEEAYRRNRFSRSEFQQSTQGLVFGLHNAR